MNDFQNTGKNEHNQSKNMLWYQTKMENIKKKRNISLVLGFIVGKAPLYCQTETSKGPKKTISKLS